MRQCNEAECYLVSRAGWNNRHSRWWTTVLALASCHIQRVAGSVEDCLQHSHKFITINTTLVAADHLHATSRHPWPAVSRLVAHSSTGCHCQMSVSLSIASQQVTHLLHATVITLPSSITPPLSPHLFPQSAQFSSATYSIEWIPFLIQWSLSIKCRELCLVTLNKPDQTFCMLCTGVVQVAISDTSAVSRWIRMPSVMMCE